MAEEGKGIALAILGIVAVIAVVGLVLLFKGGLTGKGIYGGDLTRGQQYDSGYVRYDTGRVYSGALYVYPERIEDTGGSPVPVPTYDMDYKRTGPIKGNPCPFSPYNDRSSALYADGRECVPGGTDPSTGEVIVEGFEDYLCCI
jgi:hypothetical protein